MIEGALLVWYLLTAASVAFMIYDLFMKSMLGGNYAVALRGTFFAEFVSMNMVMVGMIPTMVILMHALPESRNPLHPLFWGVMSIATLAGGFTAYPINSWMVRRGIKHGMMSTPAKTAAAQGPGGMHGMAMPASAASNAPIQHSARLSVAAQTGVVVVLTLLALAVAVWLTTRVAPIRL